MGKPKVVYKNEGTLVQAPWIKVHTKEVRMISDEC